MGEIIVALRRSLASFGQGKIWLCILVPALIAIVLMVGMSIALLDYLITSFIAQPPMSWFAEWGAEWLAKAMAALGGWLLILSASYAVAILLTALLVLGPLIVIAARSVLVGGQWSTAGWELLFSPGETTNAVQPWRAVLASLRTSIAATLLAVVVGGAAAVGLAMGRRGTWLRSVDAMMLLPLGTSAVTVGLGMLLAFGRPPVDLRNTGLLIVLAQALVAMPFVVRVLAPGFESFDRRYLEVAAVLGRSTWQAVRSVAVPLLLPLITVAVGFAFAVTLGEFGATVFLATPADPTLPVAISRLLARPGAVTVAAAYAASTVLMLITVAVVVAVDRVRVGRAVVF